MTSLLGATKPATSSSPWIAGTRPSRPPRIRLFCLPYAGGGASVYRQWSEDLPVDVDVCAIQLPGRERRYGEPAFTSMEQAADALEAALRPHLDTPFLLFGHSMGASIAHELAHRLETRGKPPLALMVSGRRAPHLPSRTQPIHALSDSGFIQELARLNGTPTQVLENVELMELMLPLLRADFKLIETHRPRPRPPLTVPVIAFGGTDDDEAGVDELQAWSSTTNGDFRLHLLPGDHFFINSERRSLVRLVTRELNLLSPS